MEQRTEPGAEVITIIAEPGALTFATRKEWHELPEMCLDELQQHEIVMPFMCSRTFSFCCGIIIQGII